jgi:hypothetical protein
MQHALAFWQLHALSSSAFSYKDSTSCSRRLCCWISLIMRPLLPLLPLQLVHEFRLLLLLGRTLCHRQPGVSMTCTRLVQYRAAVDSISERQVDLIFPATERTVLRLMQAWWDRKVGLAGWLQVVSSAPLGFLQASLCCNFKQGPLGVPASQPCCNCKQGPLGAPASQPGCMCYQGPLGAPASQPCNSKQGSCKRPSSQVWSTMDHAALQLSRQSSLFLGACRALRGA